MTKKELDTLYIKALDLREEGDVNGALTLFLQCAALGVTGAQNAVGMAYKNGEGVEQDKVKAILWFKKAWRTDGRSSWCNNIAVTYAEIGNSRQAIHWWKKAVARGDGDAALNYAKFLLKSNPPTASKRILSLLKMAAESRESWGISIDGKEEAQELLERLTATAS